MQYLLLEKEQLPIAVEMLCEAFIVDPILQFISDDPKFPRFIYSMVLPFYFKHGEIWINSEHTAVLVCLTPETCTKVFKPSINNILKMSLLFGPSSVRRILKIAKMMQIKRPKKPHYYVVAIATTHDGRRKGYAGEILRYFMLRAQREGTVLYGENSNPPLNTGYIPI